MSQFDRNRPQPGINRPSRPQQIQIPGAAIMIGGLRAEYVVRRHAEKLSKHPLDVGVDLFASSIDPEYVKLSASWNSMLIGTGVQMVFPPAIMGMITSRSSSAVLLKGALCVTGIIDPHYSGELLVRYNYLAADHMEVWEAINKAKAEEKAIAQIIPVSIAMACFAQWDAKFAAQLSRGISGFGSTDPKGD